MSRIRRGKPEKIPTYKIFIICEGKKTEPSYLKSFRSSLPKIVRSRIEILRRGDSKRSDPLGLVEYMKEKKKEIDKRGKKDVCWCVFDRDEHEWVAQAITQARHVNVKIAFSNPCFELWYLLHFQNQNAYIERDKVVSSLKKYLKDYCKGKSYFEETKEKLAEATERAESLRKMHKDKGTTDCDGSNPSTSVDLLLKALKKMAVERSTKNC